MHDRICPQCCGEQREVTLDCPSECPYLQQARQHEKPRSFGDNLTEELFPGVELGQDFLQRHEPLMIGLTETLLQLSRADRKLNDRDVIGALTTLARSYQTLVASGLVYQETSPNPAQSAIMDVLQRSIEDFREVERQHRGYTGLRDSEVLKVLVFMIRLAHLHSSGRPLARGFLDFLQQSFPERPSADAVGSNSGSRIIMP